ncbi:MAG: hypothetical protein U9Q31_01315 [Chloroflexota bacterium]|nr:hypothetical protein [Chloroflexota bacterium]
MSKCTKEEIAAILHAAEILKQKGFSEKINVSAFCREAGISRKNAYKHKKKINVTVSSLEDMNQRLQQQKQEVEQKLHHAEKRARQADLYWELRNILVTLNADIKKNGSAWTPERQKLTDEYNRISSLLGQEPHNFWD